MDIFTYIVVLLFVVIVLLFLKPRPKLDLNQKTILLTGGCQGIGLEILHILMKQHSQIVLLVVDIFTQNQSALENQYSSSSNRLIIQKLDITDFSKLHEFISKYQIDVLINNAGIFRKGNVVDKGFKTIEKTMQVNLMAPIYLIKQCLPRMIRQDWGVITNVCSLTKDIGGISMADYCSSKSALYQFHSTMRAELKSEKHNIKTNIINPYVLDGGMFANFHIPILSFIFRSLKHKDVAQIIYNSIIYQQEEVYIPSYMVILAFIYFLVPNKLIDQLQIIFIKDACKYVEKKTD